MTARRGSFLSAIVIAVAVLSTGGTAYGQTTPPATPATVPTATDAEVRKVDVEAEKVTLRHGPIANLDMPPMTMVFRVADPAMLQKVKVGDKVRFKADKVGGQITVIELQVVK